MNALAILLSVLLLADADIPRAMGFRPTETSPVPNFANEELPLFPNAAESEQQGQTPANHGAKKATLQERTKLDLIRYVSGEFAKANKSLPAGKDGFLLYADKPVNSDILDRAVATHGAAVHAGEQVQITSLEFRDHTIVVAVKGGGKGKRHLMDHVQIGLGGNTAPPVRSSAQKEQNGPPGFQPGAGSTLYVEFKKSVPDLSVDELKQLLSPFPDFGKQPAAAVQWADTFPPDIKKDIQDHRPKVGIDREMAVAAIGKPGHKVRERDTEGNEIEDWIYGTPPDRTVFVRFMGEKVTSIKRFPQ